VLYRELDYFEQLAALEKRGAFDLELIELLLGRMLVERWEMWRPAIAAAHGPGVYPLFEELAGKLAARSPNATGERASGRTSAAGPGTPASRAGTGTSL
jgi:hypothetical protein